MSQEKFLTSIFNGSAWYLIEKLTRLVGAFLLGAWLARYLGPANYGALAYVLALVALLSFLGSFGVESLVVRDLVSDNPEQRRIISTYFFIRMGGSLLVPIFAIGYLALTNADARLLIILASICSGSVIFGAFDVADCWLQAKRLAKATSSIRLAGFLIGALVKCLLILAGANVVYFAVAMLVEAVVVAALYFRLLSHHELAPSFAHWNSDELKRIFADGRMMALSGLMVVVYSKLDVLVVGTLLSKEVLASYAIASSMCSAWNMVGISLVQSWAPRISSAANKNEEHYISELRAMLLMVLGVSVIGSSILSFLSGYIFNLLLGDSYASGAPVFSLLVWSSVFVFSGVATSQIIVNEKIYWVSLFRTFIGMIVSIAAIIPAVKILGVIGVAGVVVVGSAAATLSILFSAAARKTIQRIVLLR